MNNNEPKAAQAEPIDLTVYLRITRQWSLIKSDDPFYKNKVFFLKDGRIGMDLGGTVIIRSIEHWMSLGGEKHD
jgi:hypothetical protein